MVLVLALSAALCLQAFSKADAISRETEALDAAVLLAQNTAETLKAEGWAALGAPSGDGLWQSEHTPALTLQVQKQASGLPGLAQAGISVLYGGDVIFSLTAAWQEGGDGHG